MQVQLPPQKKKLDKRKLPAKMLLFILIELDRCLSVLGDADEVESCISRSWVDWNPGSKQLEKAGAKRIEAGMPWQRDLARAWHNLSAASMLVGCGTEAETLIGKFGVEENERVRWKDVPWIREEP